MVAGVPSVDRLPASVRHLPPRLSRTCPVGPASGAAVTVQVNEVEPVAPRLSMAVTVTVYVPALAGNPVVSPPLLMESPGGRPLAEQSCVVPDTESVTWVWRNTGRPAAVLSLP